MYCIIHKTTEETMFLAWQKPAWDESGYFWTNKDNFVKCIHNSTPEHPFLFSTREDGVEHLKSINIPQKCSVVRCYYNDGGIN